MHVEQNLSGMQDDDQLLIAQDEELASPINYHTIDNLVHNN